MISFVPAQTIRPWRVLAAVVALSTSVAAGAQEISTAFHGGAVPSGSVTHIVEGTKHILMLSSDFSIHDEPPDPHWRVVDSNGNIFLLEKLKVEGERLNSSIVLPAYIQDVSKVQMWCAFAEVVLGEVTFAQPIALTRTPST